MSAVVNFFKSNKKKTNKSDESASAIQRGKGLSASMRYYRSNRPDSHFKDRSSNGGVYLGTNDNAGYEESLQGQDSSFEGPSPTNVQSQRYKPSVASSVVSSSSRRNWYRSPYEVVTEPKTKKSSRSCPGGAPSHNPLNSSHILRNRHHSPVLGSSRHQMQYPTIHEVSGCYENYAPGSSDSQQQLYEQHPESSQKRDKFSRSHNLSNTSKTVRGPGSFVGPNQRSNYNQTDRHPAFGSILPGYRNKYHHTTSEYGSADPSPTNQFPNSMPVASSTSDVYPIGGGDDFENTDYDSDSDAMPTDLVQLCTQQLRRVNGKCKKNKEAARRYQARNLKLLSELQRVNEQLENEKNNNKILRKQLLSAKEENRRLSSCLLQISENVPPAHYPNQHFQQFIGAGEAMCSRTDSNTDLQPFSIPCGMSHFREHLKPIPKNLFANQITDPIDESEQREELKSFRQDEKDSQESEFSYNDYNMERPRRIAGNDIHNTSSCKLSPPMGKYADKVIELDRDSVELNLNVNNSLMHTDAKTDDGYSTMLQEQKPDTASKVLSNAEKYIQSETAGVEAKSTNESPVNQNHLKGTSALSDRNDTVEESIGYLAASNNAPDNSAKKLDTKSRNYYAPRRSFSDSDISKLCLEENEESADDIVWSNEEDGSYVPQSELLDYNSCDDENGRERVVKISEEMPHRRPRALPRSHERNGSLKISKRSKFCHYSPKRHDYSSSYSSDDDAIRVIAKQLRKRGEVVHFKPPQRKNLAVVNCNGQLFRHFGPQERQAIAQFEYLRDIPTDVSGLLSSPDPHSPERE
ncbi:hypothetical protein DdX_06451 [Ditylenchus destructor]|uniref:BZIP domain-containing protein n=1 Tax=Ditylenchus destructor TaxID=166010 RepID=A0AAD4N771_9BILA|nr:hypothetical protein DdX_06451 [Ditylenchus destructor]